MEEDIEVKAHTEKLSLWFGDKHILNELDLKIYKKSITAIIGPSGCGKSTLLRCFNRMNDYIDLMKMEGKVFIDQEDIYNKNTDVYSLRTNVGMVFQKPTPFPKSIYENVAYGLRIQKKDKKNIEEEVVKALKDASLWEEVKDRLNHSALSLSGGQQQRLCIARALAVNPEIILLDEATSALDPQSTAKIEELLDELRNKVTIIIVTHNIGQAGRLSDYTAFLLNGSLIEFERTEILFTNPSVKKTENYLNGKFG